MATYLERGRLILQDEGPSVLDSYSGGELPRLEEGLGEELYHFQGYFGKLGDLSWED